VADNEEPPDKMGNWSIMRAEGETSAAVFRVRMDQPDDAARFPVNVSITWAFDGDDAGFPPPATLQEMDRFEDAIAELGWPPGPSYLVLVCTGMNEREWQFYATDYTDFIEAFNEALADCKRLPLNIEYTTDPGWQLWHEIRDEAVER
jgi:hypothetical protein